MEIGLYSTSAVDKSPGCMALVRFCHRLNKYYINLCIFLSSIQICIQVLNSYHSLKSPFFELTILVSVSMLAAQVYPSQRFNGIVSM